MLTPRPALGSMQGDFRSITFLERAYDSDCKGAPASLARNESV
jgi:hypothetical protein